MTPTTPTIPYDLGNGVTGEATIEPIGRYIVTVGFQVPAPGSGAAPWGVRVDVVTGFSGCYIRHGKTGSVVEYRTMPRRGPWGVVRDSIRRIVVPAAHEWMAAHPRKMAEGEAVSLDRMAEACRRRAEDADHVATTERRHAADYEAKAAAIRTEIEATTP